MMKRLTTVLALITLAIVGAVIPASADALPSWNDGKAKQSIVNFVAKVTKEGSPDFVPPAERIAVFDNDGTLWAEQPLYFQFLFAIDRVKALAPQHPEWKEKEPFASLLKEDLKGALAGGVHSLMEIVVGTHAGLTTRQKLARHGEASQNWSAFHRNVVPADGRTARVFARKRLQDIHRVRRWCRVHARVCGEGLRHPPEQVIGSSGKLKFELRDGKPVLVKLPAIDFVDDKADKPVAIQKFIGRRPIAAFGNSDGDLQMLQWTCAGSGTRFCLYVHHTDAEREWAYDRKSTVGRLDKGLDEAAQRGWTIVDMKNDWKNIFAPESK
jgi:hypothetical protein